MSSIVKRGRLFLHLGVLGLTALCCSQAVAQEMPANYQEVLKTLDRGPAGDHISALLGARPGGKTGWGI